MKFRTIIIPLLLLILFSATSCGSKKIATTDAEVQKELHKKKKKEARAVRKSNKEAYKHFWSLQSKEAKKSIRKNKRYQKKKARKMKKNAQFHDN